MNTNYRGFLSIEEASAFGKEYFGDWLPYHQSTGRLHICYELSHFGYQCLQKELDPDEAERIKRDYDVYKAFAYYCGGNAGPFINEYCRTGHLPSFSIDLEVLSPMIQIMDTEINRHEIPENIIGYRALDYQDFLAAQGKREILKGDIIIDNGFMGVGLVKDSLLKSDSTRGYDTLIKIYIPAGSHALYLNLVSNRRDEQEVLFIRGTSLKVLSNKKPLFGKKRKMECEVLPKC